MHESWFTRDLTIYLA